jgi:hypothetical protein
VRLIDQRIVAKFAVAHCFENKPIYFSDLGSGYLSYRSVSICLGFMCFPVWTVITLGRRRLININSEC